MLCHFTVTLGSQRPRKLTCSLLFRKLQTRLGFAPNRLVSIDKSDSLFFNDHCIKWKYYSTFNKLKETQDRDLLSLVHFIVALEITSVCLHDMSAVSDFSLLRSWCDERTGGTLNLIYITGGGFKSKTVCVRVCSSLMYWVTLRLQSPTPVSCH